MSNRQNKCPGCGLVNFRGSAECQWCALALGGRARIELIDDAPAARKPWGLIVFALAAALLCGGFAWQAAQKAAARAEQSATAAAESDAAAKRRKRGESTSLSPHLDDETREMLESQNELIRKAAERNREFHRAIEEHERSVYAAERDPQKAREAERQTLLRFSPPRMITPTPTPYVPATQPDPPDDW